MNICQVFCGDPFARKSSLSPSRTPSPGELAWDFHVPCSDRPLLCNTLKVGFRQFTGWLPQAVLGGWEWFVDQKGIKKCRPRRCTIDPLPWADLDK
jgi:hypothetical protein